MRTLGIIPARAGSKRIPGKNKRRLGGKPLVGWSIEAARAAARLARIVVSSDDPEVLAIARGYDPDLALERPGALATDTAPALAYVQHALDVLEAAGEARYDAIAIIQPTSPLTRSADIDATLELLETSGAGSAVSVMELDHAIHPLKLKVMQGDRLLPYLEEERGRMAAHELPTLYVRNGAVYASRRAVIDAGRLLADDCRGYRMPRERSVDINDPLDLAFTEYLLKQQEAHEA